MERANKPSAAITGGSGYLGRRLAAHLLAEGWRVRTLGRRPSGLPGAEHEPFSLGESLSPDRLEGVDAVVHCAWDFEKKTWSGIEKVNIRGSQRLFDSVAAAESVRLVHVSTVSASGNPRSMYGRAKLLTETMATERGGMVVRPGLLYGPEPGGMVGMLRQLVRALPLVPVLVGSRPPLYLAHEDDVCSLLRMVAQGEESTDLPLVAASRDPHSLREVLNAIATTEELRRLFFRVPWQAVYYALRVLELARIPLPMRADSALSIGTLDPDPFASGATPRLADFRPFEPAALSADLTLAG
jgi:nucleoside-diphosphate-sugar epimerase